MALPLKAAVIGAGVSGLAAARALNEEGHRVVVYEKSGRIGGTWVYDPRVDSDPLGLDPNRHIIHGSLYQSLRTNLPRQLMGFLDYPFATTKYGDSRTFPSHKEVLQFLNEFAEAFGLIELIQFETEVVRVERTDSKWIVESRSRRSNSIEMFDAVVVCNGHHTRPRLASFPGIEKWPGKQMHSHNYRVPEPFQDRIVVIIGNGPSAKEISKEISKVAKEVHLSCRSHDIKASKLDCAHNMWQHSQIDHVEGNGEVSFQDGACIHADIILHCTGFKYDFPFLNTQGYVNVDDNRVGPLYKHVFPPDLAPALSFVGLPYNQAALFLLFDLQAKWIAKVLSSKVVLPSSEEMMTDVEEDYRHMHNKGIPKHHTHSLSFQFDYVEWLSSQLGLDGVDEVKLIHRSYFEFSCEKGFWGNKEWQLGYRQEDKRMDKLSQI